jgi:hypothetical protein
MREVRFSDRAKLLLQLRVLGLGLLQDGDFGIGIFPKSEKILIGGLRLRGVAIDGICAAKLKMRQRPKHIVRYDSPVINDVLKFGSCLPYGSQEDARGKRECRANKRSGESQFFCLLHIRGRGVGLGRNFRSTSPTQQGTPYERLNL